MSTKTFSGRGDEAALAFADSLAREQYGMSFGQYCGTVLLEAINRLQRMPELPNTAEEEKKVSALHFIKGFSSLGGNPEIGMMSDAEIKDLIAAKYA